MQIITTKLHLSYHLSDCSNYNACYNYSSRLDISWGADNMAASALYTLYWLQKLARWSLGLLHNISHTYN